MSTAKEDLHWKRSLFPELVRLAWPIAVSMLSYTLMTVVDTLFVGQLGASALAGVAWGGILSFTLLCFGIGLLRAVKVQVSQAVGAGNTAPAGESLSAGLALAVVMGGVALVVGYATVGLVRAGAASDGAATLAVDYFLLRNWGAPAVLVAVALREARYGLGDSRSPMHAALAANLANIPLNATLIFGFGLGVRGAALATLGAQALELAFLLASLRASTLRPGRLRLRSCRELWRIGAPLGAEFLLDMSAFSALAAVIARMGEVELAAHQIAIQLSHFAFLPAIAIGEAASVLAGQAVGAGDEPLVRRVARGGLYLNLGYVGVSGLLLLLGAPLLTHAFSPDPAVQEASAVLVRAAAGLTLLFSVYAIPRAVLRAVGSERFTAIVTVSAAWLITLPVAYTFGLVLDWGALGAWLGLYVEVTVGVALLWWRLAGTRWLPGARRARERLLDSLAPAPPTAPPLAIPPGTLWLDLSGQ